MRLAIFKDIKVEFRLNDCCKDGRGLSARFLVISSRFEVIFCFSADRLAYELHLFCSFIVVFSFMCHMTKPVHIILSLTLLSVARYCTLIYVFSLAASHAWFTNIFCDVFLTELLSYFNALTALRKHCVLVSWGMSHDQDNVYQLATQWIYVVAILAKPCYHTTIQYCCIIVMPTWHDNNAIKFDKYSLFLIRIVFPYIIECTRLII